MSRDFLSRPCGPRPSKNNPNAYYREDLIKLAETHLKNKYTSSQIKRMRVDELCKNLRDYFENEQLSFNNIDRPSQLSVTPTRPRRSSSEDIREAISRSLINIVNDNEEKEIPLNSQSELNYRNDIERAIRESEEIEILRLINSSSSSSLSNSSSISSISSNSISSTSSSSMSSIYSNSSISSMSASSSSSIASSIASSISAKKKSKDICINPTTIFLDEISEIDLDNLVIIDLRGKYFCYLRDELISTFKNAEEIYQNFRLGNNDFRNSSNRIYKIPYMETWIDNESKKLITNNTTNNTFGTKIQNINVKIGSHYGVSCIHGESFDIIRLYKIDRSKIIN